MTVQAIASLCCFALFIALVQIRAAMMRRKGIRAFVFGVTDKGDFLLLPVVAAILYTAVSGVLGLPMWRPLVRPFWETTLPGWFGLGFCAVALVGFAWTLHSFGDSFRVGIDNKQPGGLVTTGMFSISRNPIYACFLLFFAGLFLIHRNPVMSTAFIIFALAIHRQILREERFLLAQYGAIYDAYREKVRRYF